VSLINYSSREINCKIVYYGPGLGGKTTNIQYVYDKLAPETKGKLVTLATEMDRTLFFDFLPLELGEVKGFKTRFHLYTVPGQVYYNASRKLILRGVDGIVFVADSSECALRREHRGALQPAREPEGIRPEPRRDPLRDAVEQARHAGRDCPSPSSTRS
jgi:signal recognition particle receptor subunit beta